jgi:hypothetical protein
MERNKACGFILFLTKRLHWCNVWRACVDLGFYQYFLGGHRNVMAGELISLI